MAGLVYLATMKATNNKQKEADFILSNAMIIEQTLEPFGIAVRVVNVDVGEGLAEFFVELALGTRIDDLLSLHKELAMSLASPSGQVEIIAPVKGTALICIKVPLLSRNLKEKKTYEIYKPERKEAPREFNLIDKVLNTPIKDLLHLRIDQ